MDTIDKIFRLLEHNGLSNKTVSDAIQIPASNFTEWKKRRNKPSTDAIAKIAKYFNVTSDYLLGLEDEPMSTDDIEVTMPQGDVIKNNFSKGGVEMRVHLTKDQVDFLRFIREEEVEYVAKDSTVSRIVTYEQVHEYDNTDETRQVEMELVRKGLIEKAYKTITKLNTKINDYEDKKVIIGIKMTDKGRTALEEYDKEKAYIGTGDGQIDLASAVLQLLKGQEEISRRLDEVDARFEKLQRAVDAGSWDDDAVEEKGANA